MTSADHALDQLCINAVRTLSIDAVQKANSGHPGLPLGAAPMAYMLWQYHLRHNPSNPKWANRDRFLLSAGHGSMLLYSLLHLTGYDLSLDDVKAFRQWESKTPGHPESFMTPGVEATTGPLGQGTANAVGMAMAERALAHQYNRPGFEIVDHFTYALVSDGDLMEGISAEAASLAGHLRLGKLIYLYDDNKICLDGPTSLTYTEDVAKRYESYGWQVLKVADGDRDFAGLDEAIKAAKADTERPSMILINTTIGFGSPNKAGSSSSHGSPLGDAEIRLTKEALGWPESEPFAMPEKALSHLRSAVDKGVAAEKAWQEMFDAYAEKHPDLAAAWGMAQEGRLPEGWDANLPTGEVGKSIATRSAGGNVINALAKTVPWLIGGDADLSCSTKTAIKDGGSFDGQSGAGRNIHYGVREHAMGAIANGIAYHGGLRNYTATFFCFSDYMRPAIRIAAMSNLPVIFVFTHDSVGLGEDGPTHQPIEHLASLRAMPGLTVYRPADASETAACWREALADHDGPSLLVLSRQDLPVLDRSKYGALDGVAKGAYILSEAENGSPQGIIIATGSEVNDALNAQRILAEKGTHVRVVSMPSMERFAAQSKAYKEQVLPAGIKARLSVEAAATFGWDRWVGTEGAMIGLDRYGASAPIEEIWERFGLTGEAIAEKMTELLS